MSSLSLVQIDYITEIVVKVFTHLEADINRLSVKSIYWCENSTEIIVLIASSIVKPINVTYNTDAKKLMTCSNSHSYSSSNLTSN